jgi:two-component system, response regulator PdtaR
METATHDPPGRAPGLRAGARPPRSAPSVLVVDDEPLIRMMAAEILAGAGYAVAEAATADEALRMVEREPHRFSHVFTDVQMPGAIDGLMLAHMLATLYPDIMVVVTSADRSLEGEAIEPFFRFVPKPWTPIDLLNIVVPAQ